MLSSVELGDRIGEWARRYPIYSVEDALAEDDWEGWVRITEELGATLQLVGDDFFTTHPSRLRQGIREHAANAVLVKMNQSGTLDETFEVLRIANQAGYRGSCFGQVRRDGGLVSRRSRSGVRSRANQGRIHNTL